MTPIQRAIYLLEELRFWRSIRDEDVLKGSGHPPNLVGFTRVTPSDNRSDNLRAFDGAQKVQEAPAHGDSDECPDHERKDDSVHRKHLLWKHYTKRIGFWV